MNIDRRRYMIIAYSLFTIFTACTNAQGASVTVVLPQVKGTSDAEVTVPVRVKEAGGLGPLQMELLFDSQQLQFLKAMEGSGFGIGLFDFNLLEPGRVRLVMTGDPNKPIKGDGELFTVTFRAKAAAHGSSALTAELIRAWEQTPEAHDMRVTVEVGSVEITSQGQPAWLIALGAASLILVLLWFARMLREQRRTSNKRND
jgi:hypothetical protein